MRLEGFRQSLVEAALARRAVNDQTSRVRLIFSWGAEKESILEAVIFVAPWPNDVVSGAECFLWLRVA